MSTSGGGGARSWSPPRRASRYESQKRRDWHTFTRYLAAHRPPLELCRCSGAHVLEFLRYLDRFGKTRVHEPLCAAYGCGGGGPAVEAAAPCQCPLRQAWGSLDALVDRLRAAFEERHGASGGMWTSSQSQLPADGRGGVGVDGNAANLFAARAVRLYLRDVRDAQSRARGISYSRKKKKRSKQQDGAAAATAARALNGATLMHAAALPPAPLPPPPPPPPPPYCLAGVPFEFCDYGSVLGGVTANGAPGFYLPSLFNTFG